MLEVIEKLLILQDRDRKILKARAELESVGPQRNRLNQRLAATRTDLEKSQHHVNELESQRKELELEVESQKEHIARYSNQQMQTKKNEEYQALGREIENAKNRIAQLEDRQLDLMEQIEEGKERVKTASREAEELKTDVEKEITELNEREEFLTHTLKEFESTREELTGPIDERTLKQYERLLKSRGERAVVELSRGICGGCHMKLPSQEMIACKREEEIVTCPYCGRILYYTRDMELSERD